VEVEQRPWGGFEVLSDTPTHKVKRLTVEAGSRLSYQRHRHRSEHWFVVSGAGEVTLEGSARRVGPGETVDVPAGAAHRIESLGPGPLVFIEVQHGTSFEEDDIERLEDDYGRVREGEVS
jgi:mannose-6-phosphate isomerase